MNTSVNKYGWKVRLVTTRVDLDNLDVPSLPRHPYCLHTEAVQVPGQAVNVLVNKVGPKIGSVTEPGLFVGRCFLNFLFLDLDPPTLALIPTMVTLVRCFLIITDIVNVLCLLSDFFSKIS